MCAIASTLACLTAATAIAAAGPALSQTMAPPSSQNTGALGMSGAAPGGTDPSCGGEYGAEQNAPCAGQQTGPMTGPTPRPPSVTPTTIPRSPSAAPTPLPNQPGATR